MYLITNHIYTAADLTCKNVKLACYKTLLTGQKKERNIEKRKKEFLTSTYVCTHF